MRSTSVDVSLGFNIICNLSYKEEICVNRQVNQEDYMICLHI